MDNSFLDYRFEVDSCDMDVWGYLKPTAILRTCQQTAYIHAQSLGFGYENLQKSGCVWVLSRVKVDIERLPVWGDKIRVRTWHKRQVGIFSLRDYIFYDQEEQPIIRVTTSWLIINIATRRITRPDRLFSPEESFMLVEYPHDAISIPAEKVEIASEEIFLSDHRVLYSNLDINHHVNNTRYLEWACDNSPQQMLPERTLSHFSLNFNHEATYNQVVQISASGISSDTPIFEGRVDSKSIFTAELSYKGRE